MSFVADVDKFRRKTMDRAKKVHDGCCDLAFSSIVEGSSVTGAPGQPVDTSHLKNSWQNVVIGPYSRWIMTNTIYAPMIEDAIGPYGELSLRSQVGGFHSIKLTRAAWSRIVAQITAEVTGG